MSDALAVCQLPLSMTVLERAIFLPRLCYHVFLRTFSSLDMIYDLKASQFVVL